LSLISSTFSIWRPWRLQDAQDRRHDAPKTAPTSQEISKCLLDAQDHVQHASKAVQALGTPQETSRRLQYVLSHPQDFSNLAECDRKTPRSGPRSLPRPSRPPKSASDTVKYPIKVGQIRSEGANGPICGEKR